MSSIAPECCVADDVPGSVVAGLDPRIRLVTALGVIAGIIALSTPLALGAALAGGLVLVALARLPATVLRHRLMHVEGFMLVLLVLLPFTTPGTALFVLGPVAASGEGLARALTIALKVNAAMLSTFALLGSLEPVRLGRAAAQLGLPERLVHLFLFAVRYVGVFRAEATRLVEAMRARAFVARSNRHTWRTLGNLAGLLLLRSLERAERVEEAMRCRGHAGRLPATPTTPLALRDFAFTATTALAVGGLIVADRLT